MTRNQKFYLCQICQNLISFIDNKGASVECCGSEMTELVPNTVDASKEKHVPDCSLSGDALTVNVGSAPHPMTPEHNIAFVYVETANGGQRKSLAVNGAPSCKFTFADDKPVAVYAYCNLHGLWKTAL